MDEKKIIAVVGATGAQGGGVCRAILTDVGGGYGVRALTRNAGSGKAKRFAEIVAAAVLGGEISMGAAIACGEFVAAHEQYGRNRPTEPQRRGSGQRQ